MRKLSSFDQFLRVLISATLFVSCTPEEQLEEDPSTETPSVSAPSALYVEYSKDTNSETTVTVAGVASGQTVTLYSDSGCQTQLAQGTASATSISFNVTGLSAGSYTYYAKARSGSDESACSTASITYEVASCPTGYVKVPANPSRGVPPFCVMQFEAKDVGGVPTSQAALTPWMNLSANSAKSECQSLNSGASTAYDLISNQEWMTIAENAQGVAANWNNGNIGSSLNYGHSTNEQGPLAVADTNDPWTGVTLSGNPTTIHDYRRTHNLSNGEVLWDLAGNASEIVDFGTSSTYLTPPACASGGAHVDAEDVVNNNTCPALATTHYMPVDPTDSYGMQYVGSFLGNISSGRTLTRGGASSYTTQAGLVGLHYSVNDPATATGTNVGFRCVYRLNPVVGMSTPWAKNFDTTPDITVSGVQYGYTVNLYTDSSCSTQVASKVSTGSSVTLTTSALAVGTHNFYFKVTNRNNVTSACSTTSIPYEVFTCPANYLAINGSTTRGVNPFCVMKYEARHPGSPEINNYPTTSTDGGTAKGTCISHNGVGPVRYNLISNLEWMTVADNIAAVAANWSSGTVGSGFINRGNTNGEKSVLRILDESDHWNGVTSGFSSTTEFNYRRTHYLTSGEVIWDIGGNASEIVDYGTGTTGGSFQMGPACTQGDGTSVQELSAIQSGNACAALATTHYLPSVSSYGSTQGAGVFIPRQSNSVLVRGGNDLMGNDSGIYGLSMPTSPTSTSIGYRCVYRP